MLHSLLAPLFGGCSVVKMELWSRDALLTVARKQGREDTRVRARCTLPKASDLLPPIGSTSKLPIQSINEPVDEVSTLMVK